MKKQNITLIEWQRSKYKKIQDANLKKSTQNKKNELNNKIKYTPKPFKIYAPKIISLSDKTSHLSLLFFLKKLRDSALIKSTVHIDFSQTEKLVSCGTILLLAEVDNLCRKLYGKCIITCSYPKNLTVEKALQKIGFFKILGKNHRQEITDADITVAHWHHATGMSVEPEIADDLFQKIKKEIPQHSRKIVRGTEEAITNSCHHAYGDSRGDGMPHNGERRWWLFAEVLDGWLHVVMCDLGIGIDRSLPSEWLEDVIDILKIKNTAQRRVSITQRAFQLGRTRTNKKNRGKGLKDILRTAQLSKGVLSVYSNYVWLRFDCRSNTDAKPLAVHNKKSILGTIVQWSIPVGKREES